jgi:SAM-dependent methyltransferase
MPAVDEWEALFDVELILNRLGIAGEVGELGCGYGTFTLPLARRSTETVHAIDIDPSMADTVRRRAEVARLSNVAVHLRDVTTEGFGLEDSRCDGYLLFNILHGESPVRLIREARRVLRLGGDLAVIHWRIRHRDSARSTCGNPPALEVDHHMGRRGGRSGTDRGPVPIGALALRVEVQSRLEFARAICYHSKAGRLGWAGMGRSRRSKRRNSRRALAGASRRSWGTDESRCRRPLAS